MVSTLSTNKKILLVSLTVLFITSFVLFISSASRMMLNGGFGMPGTGAAGSFPQGGFQPGSQQGESFQAPDLQNRQEDFQGNFPRQGRTGFGGMFGATRSLGISPLLMLWAGLIFSIFMLGLVAAALFGAYWHKKWGLNVATLCAVLMLFLSAPSLFSLGGPRFDGLQTSMNLLRTLSTLPILGLSILPSFRDEFTSTMKK